ncbi:molecular chaperone HtpG [Candidatus Walczuchella endosymbiont of Icerya purchasi]|uniref:molecular chaperone HtpG n=1 Tax=Candidatus Walczuchella endosymbiont of Icerya purchasi TaxID=3066219 RepID=UPI00313EB33C
MSMGTINVTAENIFPIIKKFLYSDHEIFLRELISNATDATLKLRALAEFGEIDQLGNPQIEIKINKEKNTLHILDQGIGLTEEEIEKYINQIAFSGAEEFLNKYKNKTDTTHGMIGHFGLGFYSSFMVSDKVEIFSKSYKKEFPAVHWSCDGSPKFSLEIQDKKEHGTEIVLHINEDSKEFLEEYRILELLNKYCKFMPIPIKFGERETTDKESTIDNIINDPTPAWTKQPSTLVEDDYKKFYRVLYPSQFEDPLFWIHLNIDHPFHLTGILFFPKLKNHIEIQKDKIQLYQNQVFVTDNVENIVPEFLHLLRGVIDSPDIPLNVSRSYLQYDASVKKISGYITRKVADKLESIFKNDRKDFEIKWEYIKIIIEYGMLSEAKFFDRVKQIALYPNTEGIFYTFDEFTEKIKEIQTDKNGKCIYLYAYNKEAQHSSIQSAKEKGYEVILLDSPLAPHLIQKLEEEYKDVSFSRVDSDNIDNIIKKEENRISKLSENDKNELKKLLESNIDKHQFTINLENLNSKVSPFIITIPELMRRMKEIRQMSGRGMLGIPEGYNLVVNINHELIQRILSESDEVRKKQLIEKSMELALISQNLLHGERLSQFVSRSFNELIEK